MRQWLSQQLHALREDLNTGHPPLTRDGVVTLIATSVLLTIFYYYGRSNFYASTVGPLIEPVLGLGEHPLGGVFPYLYWGLASIAIRIVIPVLLIVIVFRDHVRDYGFALWKKGHTRIYLGLYVLMLPVLTWASMQPDFIKKYPFYKDAAKSLAHFVLYELAYGAQFAAGEAFFRGFVLFALFKRFGYNAILIMTIPYCMIHFNKPIPETLGSIIAGIVLGYMALKSKSWLPGALLHWSIGFTMDLLCLVHKGTWKF